MIADIFGLLTRLRVSRRPLDLEKTANGQQWFPLVGGVVGFIAAIAAVVLADVFGKDLAMITGGMVLVVLYSITGILHTEGLADFADGLMASGSPERKREAMKDVHLGAAGVFAVVLFLILFFAAATLVLQNEDRSARTSPLPWDVPFAFGFVISEVAGKLAMNVSMFMGPISHEGMGSLFVRRSTTSKLVVSVAVGCAIAFLTAGFMFALLLIGLVGGVFITSLARKHFSGVSGDAFGAANEVGRLATLIGWVLLA